MKSIPAIPDRFNSEQQALETILTLARGFVDSGMKIQEPKNTAQKNVLSLSDQRSGGYMVLCALLFLLGLIAGSLSR